MADDTPTGQDDWIAGATDSIVGYVDKARSLGTDNAVRALRGIVFGLVALVFGVAALILSVIMLIRLADAYLPIGAGVGDATWAAYLLIGSLLGVSGLGLWGSRKNTGLARVWLALGIDGIILAVIITYGIVG